MCGHYQPVDAKTGELKNVTLTPTDILLFERIYSFYECGQDCYMTNAEFAKQIGFCEATISKHIGYLKKIGLVKTYTERKYNGRIKDKRYIYVQPERMEQIIAERKKAAKEGHPYDCLLLQPLELYLLEEQPLFEGRTFEVPPFEEQAEQRAETQPFEETEQKPRRREAPKEK